MHFGLFFVRGAMFVFFVMILVCARTAHKDA